MLSFLRLSSINSTAGPPACAGLDLFSQLNAWALWRLVWLLLSCGLAQAQCFSNRTDHSAGSGPQSVALGDVNGDGRPDIVTANRLGDNVAVLLGRSSGGYSGAQFYAVGTRPYGVALGDVNADGQLDIVTANLNDNSVTVLLAQAAGGYAAQSYDVGNGPISVALGDLNADGRLDIVTADRRGNNVTVLLARATGGYAAQSYAVGSGPYSLALGDVNADGRPDIVTANLDSDNVTVLLAQTAGGYASQSYAVGSGPDAVVLGDVNADGRPDIVVSNVRSDDVTILLAQTAGGFASPQSYAVGDGPYGVAVGDINADGRLDIVATLGNADNVTVLLAQASGGYASQSFAVGEAPYSIAVGDVNADGRPDIVTGNYYTDNVTVLSSRPVAITRQPASGSSVCQGVTVTASVSANEATSTYQWYRNGNVVTGQTSATLTLTDVQPALAGSYSVVVTGSCSSVTSTAFTLTVTPQSPDYQPLADLYNTTNGANWTRNDNWLTGCTPCGWYGVTCDGNGRVINLTLQNNKLNGSIPTSLSALTTLQVLRLVGNSTLTGPIPASLSTLSNLRELSLQDNQLSGGIPGTLANLSNLKVLNLGQNLLSGSVPGSLSALTGIQVAYFNNNQLSGCFPASLSAVCGKLQFGGNPGLPGGGDFGAFCTRGAGSDAFRPLATARPNPVCVGNPVSLSVSAGTSYAWSGPAGFSAFTQTPGFTPASAASSGLYVVTVGNGSPTCIATTSVNLTVNALPVTSITNLASAYCKDASPVVLTGIPAGGNFTVNGAPATQVVPANLAPGSYTVAYSYTNSSGCSATTTQNVTINALPSVSIVPSALTGCAGTIITLSALGADRYVWNTGATTTSIPVTATGTTVYSVTGTASTGCSATASQSITIYPVPSAPGLLTQSGQRYPGGQVSVSVDVNSGNVNLVVSGCSGSITWTGPAGSSGSTSPIVVSTDRVGTFVYNATCTSTQGCTSPISSATVTVQGRLTVLHRDVDNYATNNAIQPLLQLQNQGSSALPLSAITLRYYVTVEGGGALSNLSVNYAQVGNQNIRLRYVPLQPAQQGAAGYVEVSFTAGAGNLAAGANSGPIQTYFTKGDYSALNETDDYSYNPMRDQLTATQRITAYYNGVLIAGVEPGSTASVRAVRALTESRNGPSATQINTVLEVRNEGTVAINYADLRARYYFTSDGAERLQVEVDEGNVSAQLVALSQPVAGANYYLEIRYNQGGQLSPGASTGAIRYRISKPDGGRFNQTNDYSYQEQPQERSQNSRVVVLVGQEVVWGTPPTGSNARLSTSQEPRAELQVTVLGNPVRSDNVSVQIKGAGGEPLQLQLVSAQGRIITQQQIANPQVVEQHDLSLVGQGPGVFLLQVITPTQTRIVRVLKAE